MVDSQYIMLLSSLPKPRRLETLKVVPISRIRLEKRLSILPDEDLALLLRIRALLGWQDASDRNLVDAEYLQEAQSLLKDLEKCEPDLQELILHKFEVRTLVAALRMQRRGLKASDLPEAWGLGQYAEKIRKNWEIPGFGLERTYRWLREGLPLLNEDRAKEFENLILMHLWKYLSDFLYRQKYNRASLAAYLLSWGIADRWTRYEAGIASERFQKLLDQAVPSHGMDLPATSPT